MRIGFIGLGNMGAAIAANLVKAKHDVVVWNRSAEKAKPLVEAGAHLAKSVKVAADRDVVFTMLAEDDALNAVLDAGLLEQLPAGALHVSLSTISVATADKMTEQHLTKKQHLLCAPVFGRPQAAAAAKLWIAAGGERSQLELATPLFDAIGQRTFHVGEKPSSACLVKLCGNFLILAAVESLGEAVALSERGGVSKKTLIEILTTTIFDSPVYRNYGQMIVNDQFKPAGFPAPLGLKDMRLVGQSAEALRVPMPVLGILRDHLLQAIAQEGEDTDWSTIAKVASKNAQRD